MTGEDPSANGRAQVAEKVIEGGLNGNARTEEEDR